jgi:hypothetical protein
VLEISDKSGDDRALVRAFSTSEGASL